PGVGADLSVRPVLELPNRADARTGFRSSLAPTEEFATETAQVTGVAHPLRPDLIRRATPETGRRLCAPCSDRGLDCLPCALARTARCDHSARQRQRFQSSRLCTLVHKIADRGTRVRRDGGR